MSFKPYLLIILLFYSYSCIAQTDTSITSIKDISKKYFEEVESKATKYSNRLTSKTEKTLTKLSNWENRIKRLLEKASPTTAQQIFAPGAPTFTSVLNQYKSGKEKVASYKSSYDEYRDKLTTGLKYLEQQKDNLDSNALVKIARAARKTEQLNEDIAETEAMQKFIVERKKVLIQESFKYISKSKYLQKINKESFYYVETLKNYREIFNDKKKAEETAITILNKIPAFQKFVKSNGMLSTLFRSPDNNGNVQSLAGLQTRASVNALIQDRIASGGPNAREMISQNFQAAQNELNKLKEKILKPGVNKDQEELPEFKTNMQKTKTFLQRLEFGSNLQFGKSQSFVPANTNIGLQAGYKLNEKSTIGVGASYKMGIGSIEKIRFTSEGIGLRSFIDWKLKKQFFISGGYEMNYNTSFKSVQALKDMEVWQPSGLIGLSKKLMIKNKLVKGSKLQLLYDFLYNQNSPATQPVVFRIGYIF